MSLNNSAQKNSIEKLLVDSIPEINAYRADLDRQRLWWSVVSIVGKVNNQGLEGQLLESISETQTKFEELSDHLISLLVKRYQDKAEVDLSLRSRAFIDILNRNLFERTADVGFLAADEKLVQFLTTDKVSNAHMAMYLREYVLKYSVYRDIVVLSRDKQVLARLDGSNHTKFSTSEYVDKALNSSDYVECDQPIDIMPQHGSPLTYLQRIESGGQIVGVICLSFKMDDELIRINDALAEGSDFSFGLVSESQEVMFPADTHAKCSIEMNSLELLKGEQGCRLGYSTTAQGYQEFMGLPWRSLVSIDLKEQLKQHVLTDGLVLDDSSSLFPADLHELNLEISTALLIVILNGKIMSLKSDAKAFLPVLDSFQEIGREVRKTFSSSIQHIHEIAYQTVQSEVGFLSKIAMDVMDRNLYERANDCRWWSLNEVFRSLLKKDNSNEAKREMTNVLVYINELYTVYTNIFVYDKNGTILAISNPAESLVLGKNFHQYEDFQRALKLTKTQTYSVSEFNKSEFYNGRETYLYHAAVRDCDNITEIIGGIGLVFDSEPEFLAILDDFLPKDVSGKPYDGAFAMFVEESKKIISVTHNDLGLKVGDQFMALEKLSSNGRENGSCLMTLNGLGYLVGYQYSQGYREYKVDDGYENNVVCLVFVRS